MYNWNTDTTQLKRNPKTYAIWRLEQQINFGLNGEKIQTDLLKKYWNKLHLDPKRKRVLFSWLWQKQSLPKDSKHS
ncbi:MAG: hypothetical protein ACD_13C00144G0017 [uncultured bacterium]|nr:MAG: hypothetical protein ACD_13C00144G0017 [uncultured bacterium]HAU65311.1 hypothetical protein [Candidatus Woesebacteria bacterium]HCC09205.1 hypothetical protein [Candidatus Woesebacteria bacterium]